MDENENAEDTDVSEASTLSLNSEFEDPEAETTKRKPTQETGETSKRRRTPLNPAFGDDAEASGTSRLLSKPVDGGASEPVDMDAYDNIPRAFPAPELYPAMDRYLPPHVRGKSIEEKVAYSDDILMQYAPSQKEIELREYRDKIISEYPRLHEKLYAINPTEIFVPSFIKAINEKTEDRFNNIISEPSPGILTFEIFQPEYCEMLVAEVNHFQTWIQQTDIRTEHRNNMNNMTYLDDLGMEYMLQNLMDRFISPISKAVQVDDAELTLNVCLGQQFLGGELCFQGVYCEKHVDTPTRPEDNFEYSHILGHAILYQGRNRHVSKVTTAGKRYNLVLGCKSAGFRQVCKQLGDFSWCSECKQEKDRRNREIACTFMAGFVQK
ncbi:uncharacterized PKHD-type hydroxylase At1g22950-like isoform X3 [Solanum pennellii]|uniref:Uncharacterized PKHD-type hydroxylase At1g22950-like isoform X3 n=1 Tax=Solanum pennellii TaxID=28526 RepID=A0ABM1V8E4_SOLPN|nr:uncharacterized PKHD-type hydroxylase At1g22950-like isoform X3 [Solanum pennellii]